MKLVETINKNELLMSNWAIYELSDEEAAKYGNRFALSQGIFSDYALKEFDTFELLDKLNNSHYEGFFETRKEAYMQVKLVEMECKIQKLEYAIKDIVKITNIEISKWE